MTKTSLALSSEEAAALLTCLEYYVLHDLENKENHRKGLLPDYEPLPDRMAQILNELRAKLMQILKESK
jgi:hypothetical protein